MPHRKLLNPLNYDFIAEDQELPDDTVFRIQASQIADYFDHTASWYNEKLLGQQSSFTANTGSVLGTVVHRLCEQRIKNGGAKAEDVNVAMEYVATQASDLVDPYVIEDNYLPMYHQAKYYMEANPVALAEPHVTTLVKPGILAGGSIDAVRILVGDFVEHEGAQLKPDHTRFTKIEELSGMTVEIVDWKTEAALSPSKKMSKKYEWQLLVYALVLKKEYNITVETVTDVFITRNNINRPSPTNPSKMLKDAPSTIGVVSKVVTQDSMEFIQSLLHVVADSVELFVTKPELRYIISQDLRNIDATQTLPFTSIGKVAVVDI